MNQAHWQRQNDTTALFADLLWSRPENKAQAGKLMIVGGHAQGFARPAEAFATAERAGIGTVRVLLPNVLQRTLGRAFVGAEFGPSTPSGSFATTALGELLPLANWSEGVLLAGDFGRNSETAIVLEKFIEQYEGSLTITCDAVDYTVATPYPILQRPNSCLVLSFSQLQKLGIAIKYSNAFTFTMDLLQLIDSLHELTKRYKMTIVTKHLDTIVVATAGQVTTTKVIRPMPVWRLRVATYAAVWATQNPAKPLEAMTTAVYEALHSS